MLLFILLPYIKPSRVMKLHLIIVNNTNNLIKNQSHYLRKDSVGNFSLALFMCLYCISVEKPGDGLMGWVGLGPMTYHARVSSTITDQSGTFPCRTIFIGRERFICYARMFDTER
jgi:hypothetical protein